MKKLVLIKFATTAVTVTAVLATSGLVKADQNVYRLYNRKTDNHIWTGSASYQQKLLAQGWTNEGIGFASADKSNTPVYELYNPNNGDIVDTPNTSEITQAVKKLHWRKDGVVAYWSGNIPVYRLINKKTGKHMFTSNASERNSLLKSGWKSEGVNGIGWYSTAPVYNVNYTESVNVYSGQKDVNDIHFDYLDVNQHFQAGYQNNNAYAAYNNVIYNLNKQLLQDAKNADYQNWQARQAWQAKVNQYNQTINADQAALDSAHGQVTQYQTLVNQENTYLAQEKQNNLPTDQDNALLAEYTKDLNTAQTNMTQAQATLTNDKNLLASLQKTGTDFVKLGMTVSRSNAGKNVTVTAIETIHNSGKDTVKTWKYSKTLSQY